MKVAFFSTKPYDREAFDADPKGHEIDYFDQRLTEETVHLARGYRAVCAFANDVLGAAVIQALADGGTEVLALRCAGCNHVDFEAVAGTDLRVVNVPAYSPNAVAEHAVALMQAVNRHLPRAVTQVRMGNYALHGLAGTDVVGKTVGVVGTGRIGMVFARILKQGFGAEVIAHDPYPNDECREMGIDYVPLDDLLERADIISLHCPLTDATRHLIDAGAIARLKPGALIVNTSRGAVIDTQAAIDGLKSGQIGGLGIDVYEHEGPLFFEDRSDELLTDDQFARLLGFQNVVITGHQAFLTREALAQIAKQTLENLTCIETGVACERELTPGK
ncbi:MULTISPECIES: 2-hydroxyacid dehydrogenase [unclassified Guyparkeria]|uniref:2-hydroxyacid dehydrogenase n=1 Tax=unclassified Guyparkeria TaxID=2626246 RepID=UPI0007339D0B|nr:MULTISPECIES: 2-hydroxyacid dehydrogenase [unclassified Guyparkeria]KTG17248.1 hydroxyacid dehydrogenase [Guyparkeria sp. XI15]OAE87225.1 hydroxyacid dehydrogenase [Guyparkeria sp. WRN-7]